MAGYGLLGLYAIWRVTPEFSAGARISNATDKQYVVAQGYNTAPRQFTLGIEMALD
jgi:vitamin B12 transporter